MDPFEKQCDRRVTRAKEQKESGCGGHDVVAILPLRDVKVTSCEFRHQQRHHLHWMTE